MAHPEERLEVLYETAALLDREQGLDLEAQLSKARLRALVSGDTSETKLALGRFDVLRCIGRGGMGKVFEARDRLHDVPLALKVLHEPLGDALARLKREFRSLANVSHPNLVAMYELHVEQGLPFITMELVDGPSLYSYLNDRPLVDAEFIHTCLCQLADALAALHAASIVHGDIKPSNILLRPDGRLTVVDFGLARALGDPRPSNGSGTLAYMAPERVRGLNAGPGADWFAVGAVLRDLLERADPSSTARAQGRFATLRRLCTGLLDPNPTSRFGAREVNDALGVTTAQARSLSPNEDDVFVSRDAELAQLRRAFERVAGGPVVCTVRGDPGMGKTTLVERFLSGSDLEGALVLAGRCYEGEALPYKGIDGVMDALASYLQSVPADGREAIVSIDASALLRVFPILQRVGLSQQPGSPTDDPRRERRVAFGALASILAQIAKRRRLVVFIDDLQWGDADGAALLEHLLLGAQRPAMLLIGSYRSDEAGSCVSVLQACADAYPRVDVLLGPLEARACADLALRLTGETLTDSVRASLRLESGGSPLLLRALLRAGPWPGGAQTRARSFQELVEHALQELDAESRDLLMLTALSGRPIGIRLLAQAAQIRQHPWQLVAALRSRRMLRTVVHEGEPALLPHHDRVRDAVLCGLPEEERRGRHAALARAAGVVGFDDPEFLADQYFRAGHLSEAGVHAERAGDRARDAMALQHARDLYTRALECVAPERPVALVTKLADAAAFIGDVARAAPLFLEAAAAQPQDAWELRLRAAEMWLLCGAEVEAMKVLRPAMREAGIWLPSSATGTLALALFSLVRTHMARRRRPDLARQPDRHAEIAFRVGYMTAQLNMDAMALILWSGARALRHGSAAQHGRALAYIAHVYAVLGLRAETEQDAMMADALALTLDEPTARAYVLCCDALLCFTRSNYREALSKFDATYAFIVEERVQEAYWGLRQIQAAAASACVMTGDFARLGTFVTVEREAEEVGNRPVVGQIRSARVWASLAAGDAEAMGRYSEAAMREWNSPRMSPMYALAFWGECHRLLYLGEPKAALALVQAEARRLARSGLERTEPWSVSLKQLRAMIALSCSEQPGDARWRSAEAIERRLRKERSQFAAASAAVLQGGFARRSGRREEALRHYASARQAFEQIGLNGYAAAAAYREAELREGSSPPESSVPWFRAQAIAEPAKWVRMYAP